MERNAGNGIALDPADDQTEGIGENAGAGNQSAELAPLYDKVEQALRKDRPVDALADKDRPLAAVLAGLTPGSVVALAQRARAANASQLVGARANISLAFQNAPKAFADTGSYSGVMPRPEDFAYVFGVKEGRRQLATFDQSVETGRQAFNMRVMPARDLNSQLLDAAVGAANSPEGQSRYRRTAAAAQHVLEARQKDPAGEAVKAFPQANEAWRAAAAQEWRDPAAVQNALALTIAIQRYLGVENAQPVPGSVLKDLGGLAPQDIKAKVGDLLAGTADPYVRLAMSRQFVEAGLLERPVYFGQAFSSDGLTEKSSGVAELTPDERVRQPFRDDLPIDVLLANLTPDVSVNRNQAASESGMESPVSPGANFETSSSPKAGAEPFVAAFGVDEGIKQFEKGNAGNFSADILAAKGNRKKFVNVFYQAGKSLGLTETQARLMAVQAALETGSGKSVPGFNYFGVKAFSSWKGQKQLLWTHEADSNGVLQRVQRYFRKYASLEEGIHDRIAVMKHNFPKANDAADIDSAIFELQRVKDHRYATDDNYAEKLRPYIKELPDISSR